jgi:hypothetical protein
VQKRAAEIRREWERSAAAGDAATAARPSAVASAAIGGTADAAHGSSDDGRAPGRVGGDSRSKPFAGEDDFLFLGDDEPELDAHAAHHR